MKIEAHDKEIQDIISLGYFNIPRFQRPYSWNSDEVKSFWDDTICGDQENYFIGSMVVYQTKKPYFGIVDGQQRLTTITLILASIRNAFISLGQENLAKGVHKYIQKPNIDNVDEFVLQTESSYPFLQDYIQSFEGYGLRYEAGLEEQKLESAFRQINSMLNEYIPEINSESPVQTNLFKDENLVVQSLKLIRDKILSLKLVFIQLDNEDDAYLIFETLNARGRDLTTSDLVKNLILKQIKTTSSIDQAKELWNEIVRNFDDVKDSTSLDTFLLHYWLSKYSYTTDKKLFSEIKSEVKNDPEKAKFLIRNMSDSANTYIKLVNPGGFDWKREENEIKRSLEALNLFSVKQQSSMALALLRAYEENRISQRNLKIALKKIEFFHFCFNAITSQRSSGSIATNYSKLAIELSEVNQNDNDKVQLIFNKLREFLIKKMPEKEEFIVKFSELSFSSRKTKYKNIVKHSLLTFVPDSHGGLPVDLDSLTIEHVMPESASRARDFSSDSIASIGNLILIDKRTNSEDLADKSPSQKFEYLKNRPDPYPLEGFLIDSNADWNEEAIKGRTKKMAESIYDHIFKLVKR